MDVKEFSREFTQDVLAESDADGRFVEDVFFQKSCELLMEVGELDVADRVPYRSPTRGIRVDGYGGDPLEMAGTLNLIILDFNLASEIGRLTGTEMDATFRRLSNFLRQALNKHWRDALEETSPASGLADFIAQRWHSITRIRLLLVSNRELSERVDRRIADDIEGRQVTYSVWDIRRLHSQATIGYGREDIEIDLIADFGGALPILPAQQSHDGHASYLSIIRGQVLAEIYDRWGSRLLEQNVRVFLQARGKVNRGIRITLENEPSMFFAYNNGITATADQVDIANEGGQLILRSLRNFQIVNGGQTTASIHEAKLRKIDISRTFVQMKLSVVTSERAEVLVPRISEYANSQNRVNAADFFANHPFHVRIEEFSRRIFAPSPDGTFRQSKWFYERARGQYADARANLTPAQRRKFDLENPRSQLFTKTDLAKFLNTWEDCPHVVSMGAQKNFVNIIHRICKDWKNSSDGFNEAWYRIAIAKAIVFKATERIVSSQTWYQGGYRANIVAYTIAKIAHDVAAQKKVVDFENIWLRQSQSAAMSEVIATISELVHKVLIHPTSGISNVTEWAKKQACWERVRILEVEWHKGFVDELISVQEQRNMARTARHEQRELNGIEAQIAVVKAGGKFWSDALFWGQQRRILTPSEIGILRVAANAQNKTPTDKQSSRVIKILEKLQSEGYKEVHPAIS